MFFVHIYVFIFIHGKKVLQLGGKQSKIYVEIQK